MNNKEPSSWFISLPQILRHIFNDSLFNFVEFASVIWVDQGVNIFTYKSWGQGDDLACEVDQFFDFFMDYFLVSGLASEHKLINVFEMFELVQDDSKIGG